MTHPQLEATTGRDDLALVYLLRFGDDPRTLVETVDSIDPRFPRSEKSVINISTQFGCPIGCTMCDAGFAYAGNLTGDQMLEQVRYVLRRRPEVLTTRKLKVHFARMGEPSLNNNVLEALKGLPQVVPNEGLIACISTVAPTGRDDFFTRLTALKHEHYAPRSTKGGGRFQLQFSLNSTDEQTRRRLMPIQQLSFEAIADMGRRFFQPGDRRVALNFALAEEMPVEIDVLKRHFDTEHFMIKLTPLNPTERAEENGLQTIIEAARPAAANVLVQKLEGAGFETVVSIGDADEIAIGSNCGQLFRSREGLERPTQQVRAAS
ncbi:MAG: radical SAM protein [Deltaproteobacteria bacterium]|nr:radical SAM protein [Deltaproteobacteria bacterium]